MKSLMPSACFLILFFGSCIASSSALDLGSFFRSYSAPKPSSEVASSGSAKLMPTHEFLDKEHSEEAASAYSSESYSDEYRGDPDSYTYNSSSEQELADLMPWNSSSDGNDTKDSTHNSASTGVSNSTLAGSSSSTHGSEPTTPPHASSESSKPSEVTWNKVSTPAQPSTTEGQITAANFTTEKEEVVLVTGETATGFGPKSIYQKSIDWLEDQYTLSILIPISAGIVFAITIICTIAMCRCVRRCCRRRRFRKKCLPDSVKSLSASDRARLLGDTSDEEF